LTAVRPSSDHDRPCAVRPGGRDPAGPLDHEKKVKVRLAWPACAPWKSAPGLGDRVGSATGRVLARMYGAVPRPGYETPVSPAASRDPRGIGLENQRHRAASAGRCISGTLTAGTPRHRLEKRGGLRAALGVGAGRKARCASGRATQTPAPPCSGTARHRGEIRPRKTRAALVVAVAGSSRPVQGFPGAGGARRSNGGPALSGHSAMGGRL